ncbi:MAG: homoserine O-succinyltransferase [Clostridia bacterium]
MPINVPNDLPAVKTLESENIFVIREERAMSQDIRPLKILFLNLMPTKIVTETQILRCLSNTPLQIEVDLLQTSTYTSKNTSSDHLLSFYKTFDDIKDNKYDGLIVTGAPVELMDFPQVSYIDELHKIFDWAESHIYSSLYICWGAQAALNHFYNIPKYKRESKLFGIFKHTILHNYENIFRGFDDEFNLPHSRNSENRLEDIEKCADLDVLSYSEVAGPSIMASKDRRKFFITGHFEYDAETLATEYFRDVNAGIDIKVPKNYFKNDDPSLKPVVTWRSHAQLFYSNWINYCVYQDTPYDLNTI